MTPYGSPTKPVNQGWKKSSAAGVKSPQFASGATRYPAAIITWQIMHESLTPT